MTYRQYDEKNIQSFEYETTINSDGNILGICELGKATIQLLNNDNEYSTFKGSWIQTVHGSFYVYDVKPVQEKVNIKLECYDIKYKLDTKYDSSLHTFPCTLKEWRNSIFDSCDVTYDNSDFPNSGLVLNTEPYIGNNPTNRSVIALIGQAGCSFIVTDTNDKFWFKWFDNTIHTATDWIDLTTEKEHSSAVNKVVLGRGDVEDNVSLPATEPSSPIEFRIDNNYILDPQDTSSSEDLRHQTIIPIYNRLNGLSYLEFSMRTQSIPNKLSIQLGQKVKYKDIWGNELTAYIMSKKVTYLGGNLSDSNNYEITLSAEKIKECDNEVSYSQSVKNDLLRVERKADKNSGEILDLVSRTNNNTSNIASLQIQADNIALDVSNKVGNNELISKINLSPEQALISSSKLAKILAEKIALEGYTSINGAVIFDLLGNLHLKGGDIELEDTGENSDPKVVIFDGTSMGYSNVMLGDNLSGKTLTFTWPSDGTQNPPYIINGGSSIGQLGTEIIITSSGGYEIQISNGGRIYSEVCVLTGPNTYTNLYFMSGDYVSVSLSSYTLPADFGIVTSIRNDINTFDYIKSPNLRKKTTTLKSTGLEFINRINGYFTEYKANGLTIKDSYGNKSFNENGIAYVTNRGTELAQFSADKNSLLYSTGAGQSMLLFDSNEGNHSNDSLKVDIAGTEQMKVNNDGVKISTLKADNIQGGTVTCSSSSWTYVSFDVPFKYTPAVVVTPCTSTAGVITAKTKDTSKNGFYVIIGGSGFSNIPVDWIAIGV